MQKLNPVTPGELLREAFLEPMGLSQYRFAKEIGVPAQRISFIRRNALRLLHIWSPPLLQAQMRGLTKPRLRPYIRPVGEGV